MKAYFVNKRLAFGSAITTWGNVEKLRALGVTHVLNLRHSTHNKKVREFHALWLPFKDDNKPRPARYYRHALKFHKRAMKKAGTKVFVMCHHGICRSASMVYFFLRTSGVKPKRAEALVRKARRSARVVTAYRESGERYLRRRDK